MLASTTNEGPSVVAQPSTAEPAPIDVAVPLTPAPQSTLADATANAVAPQTADVPAPPDMPPPPPSTAGPAPIGGPVSNPVGPVARRIEPKPTDIPQRAVARNSHSIMTGLKAIVESPGEGKYLHGSTADASNGFQVASYGDKKLHLSAPGKAGSVTSAWNKLTGRPTPQYSPQYSDEAIVALKLIVKTVKEDKNLKNRQGVQSALDGIEDILGKAIESKNAILLSDIKPHFQALVDAEAELRSEEAQIFADKLKSASERQKGLDGLTQIALKPYIPGTATESDKAAAVHNMIKVFNLRENKNFFDVINTAWSDRLKSQDNREAGLSGSAALQDRTLPPGYEGIEKTVANMFECTLMLAEYGPASKNPDFEKVNSITNKLVDSKYKDQKPPAVGDLPESGLSTVFRELTAALGGTARTVLNSFDETMRVATGKGSDFAYTSNLDEFVKTYQRKLVDLKFFATLLTDKEYLNKLPTEYRLLMLRCGEAVQQLMSVYLAPDGPFRAAFNVAQHGAAPEQATNNAHRVLLASAVANVGSNHPPARSVPPIPV